MLLYTVPAVGAAGAVGVVFSHTEQRRQSPFFWPWIQFTVFSKCLCCS